MKKNIVFIVCITYTLITLAIFFQSKTKEDTIYFITGFHKDIFGPDKSGFFNLANVLKKHGYKTKVTGSYRIRDLKNAKYIVVFDNHQKKLRRIKKLPKHKLILFTWEPPCIMAYNHDKKYLRYFSKVYTFNDDLIDNKKYFKFHYPRANLVIKNAIPFDNKKFCSLIISNKTSTHPSAIYDERKKAIKFFEEYAPKDFDLYGWGWSKDEFKSYKGTSINKIDTLKNYKFSICYENSKDIKGYITEKIFDCFQAASVPIYLGADNIKDYIPENCFIDKRNFKSYNELYIHLKTMSKEEYLMYLENIKDFLNGDESKVFKGEHLVQTFLKALNLN
ncbi:MAG: hypothetical protein KR126chlam4_00256 [Candidatus Anoxychlamydiales bacterium]|nr:hypothetical protein [Candidatus Anoxychlamydiales bacterium]HEU64223.1 hypothetical protein [Chlamydiota bacterium]